MQARVIRQYYVLSFLSSVIGMNVVSAVYVTFLTKHGLNLFEVNLVNAIFFTTLFICEIPTGAFADVFGRKSSFVISAVIVSLSMFVYGSSQTFVGFMCAEIIAAIGMTFRTGAFQAWLVDSLKHRGYEGSFSKIFGRAGLYNQIGGGAGAIAGSYMAVHSLVLPWFVGAAGMMLVAILAQLIMREEYFVRNTFSWKSGFASMQDVTRNSIRYASRDNAVRFILIVTFVQIYAIQALNMYWQPFFRSHGVRDEHLGFIFTGIMLSLALGAFSVSRINVGGKERQIILVSMMYIGVAVALSATSSALPLAIIFFLLHEVGRGFWGPVSDSYLHQRIPSHERATITSFCSIAHHVGGAIGLVISGLVAHLFGITVAWVVGGVVLVGGASLLIRRKWQ